MTHEELERKIQKICDYEEIDRVEKNYGYYLDHRLFDKVVDLFCEEPDSVQINNRGKFYGREGLERFFIKYMKAKKRENTYGWMVIHHQLQPVITITPDGQSAKGRWIYLGFAAREADGSMGQATSLDALKSVVAHGVYENEFVKEHGKWKFKKVQMSCHFNSFIDEGWTSVPVTDLTQSDLADGPVTFLHPYPELELLPLHWIDEA